MRFETGSKLKTDYLLADSLIELTRRCRVLSKVNILSVAHRANVHRNTVYYHFKDMAALVKFTIKLQWERLAAEIFSSVADEAATSEPVPQTAAADFVAAFFDRNYPLLKFARHELGTDKYLEFMRSILTERIDSPILCNLVACTSLVEDRPGETIKNLLKFPLSTASL